MKTLFTWLLIISVLAIAIASCNNRSTTVIQQDGYTEYDGPYYPNQQPAYYDNDYYYFTNNGGIYRRVRRNRIHYNINITTVAPMTEDKKVDVYRTMASSKSTPSSVSTPSSQRTMPTSRSTPSSNPTMKMTPSMPSSSSQPIRTMPTTRSSIPSSSSSSRTMPSSKTP